MTSESIISTQNLNLWYNDTHALQSISMSISKNQVTALIGPFRMWQVDTAPVFQPAERSH